MSIADELAKLEELRRQRVISREEFDIAKKKVLSDDNDAANDADHTLQDNGVASDDFPALDIKTKSPKSIDAVNADRFSTPNSVWNELDELAERELQAEQEKDEPGDHSRDRSQRDDRSILAEINFLDREWDRESDKYKVTGNYGHRHTPTKGGSVFMGVAIAAFGIFWTATASSMSSGFGGGGFSLFPLFGVLFACFGVGMSIWSYKQAEKYEKARKKHLLRRRELASKRRIGESDETPDISDIKF